MAHLRVKRQIKKSILSFNIRFLFFPFYWLRQVVIIIEPLVTGCIFITFDIIMINKLVRIKYEY